MRGTLTGMDIPATITTLDGHIAAATPASKQAVTDLAGQLAVTFEALRDFANEILTEVDDADGALDSLVDADRGDRGDAHFDLTEALGRLRDALIVPRLGDDPSGEHRQV